MRMCMLIGGLIAVSLPLCALSPQEELKQINERIIELQQALHQEELDEVREDVKGQEYMLADWDKYGKEIEKIRAKEVEEKQTRQMIEQLKKRRAELLKQSQ